MRHRQKQINFVLAGILAGLLVFVFQNCAPNKVAFDQAPVEQSSIAVGEVEVTCSFNGQRLTDGQTVTAYINSSVPFGQTCQSQTRTCENGVLSGTGQYARCTVGGAAACLFNGQTISHGQTVTAFVNSNAAYGQTCQSQTRTCNNGVLSGSNQFASCAVAQPAACLFNNSTIANGQTVTGYVTSSVPFGQTCQSQLRTCNNGVLSGSNQYASCTVGAAASCLFNGQTIAHGQTVTAFLNSTVGVGQTCQSQVRTCNNGVLSGTNQNASCVALQVGNKTISITDTSTYSPFKLLLIIDNSYTMSQSQAKLAQNIDSLLQPLAGKDVEIKIISTSEVAEASRERTTAVGYYYRADGTSKTVSSISAGSAEYNDSQYVSATAVTANSTYTEARGATYTLSSNDSSLAIKNKTDSIKTYITRLGVNGNDNEQVLCPLAMHLFKRTRNSFFQQGDKAAVVVLTDEDDSSKFDNCTYQRGTKYGALETRSAVNYDRYYIPVNGVKVYFSYAQTSPAVYRDGVLVSAEATTTKTDGVIALDRDVVRHSDVDSGSCVSKAQSHLRARGKIQNIDLTNTTVSRCEKITESDEYLLEGQSVTDLCDGVSKNSEGKTLLQAAQAKMTYYTPGFMPTQLSSFAKGEVISLTGCRKEAVNVRESLNRRETLFSIPIVDSKNDNEFDLAIKNEMNALFGEKYFMSFIANNSDNTCALKTGQSIGKRYENFKAINSSHVQTLPICSDSYSSAMDQVAQFAVSVVTTKYALSLPANAQITKVKLISSGVTTILDSSKYIIKGAGASAQIEMMISLKKGDQINVEYSY